ncbi:hypothetical protein [Kaistella sp.]|uniref:hypothetical protein n=1 Tax=Kaistella sp. TaxID=2782235 RepID=UPI003C6ED69B
MRVVFTEIAEQTQEKIIEFLANQWTEKEIAVFLNDVENLLHDLENDKFRMYQKYSKTIRSALIGKNHVRVYFQKNNNSLIKILLFFDVREDPNKLFDYIK